MSVGSGDPAISRVSDARETAFTLATSKKRTGFSKFTAETALPKIMSSKGWDLEKICLSFIGYEGGVAHAKHQKRLVDTIVKKHGGMGVGEGPGLLYDQKKFDTPYLRDFLLDMGAAGDVSETAAPWSRLLQVHDAVYAAAHTAYAEIGVTGWIMSHLSHSYHSGACLYFTFAFVFQDDPIAEYDTVKSAIQQAFVDNDATISHHHGVGREHAAWLEEDISPEGVKVKVALAFETAHFIEASIIEVIETLIEAILIVVVIIYLCLGSVRSVIIPIVSIPLSMLGALGLMTLFGFSINLLTLLAMVLAIGLVVDDAIVVMENIHRHLKEGRTALQAALFGAREIASPVIAMTITLAAVYMPIGLMNGLTGALFKEFALTLAGAVLVSGVADAQCGKSGVGRGGNRGVHLEHRLKKLARCCDICVALHELQRVEAGRGRFGVR